MLRCSAHYKSNRQQCQVAAAPGTNVCNQHGALIPAVQAKAATRIGMSVDDAVKRLLQMIDDPNTDNRDKIKVLHDLLDRGGLAATSKHLVGVVTKDPVEELFARLLADPAALEAPAQQQIGYDAEQAALDAGAEGGRWDGTFAPARPFSDRDDVVDAEVVEDVAPPRLARAARKPAPRSKTATAPHIRAALESLL